MKRVLGLLLALVVMVAMSSAPSFSQPQDTQKKEKKATKGDKKAAKGDKKAEKGDKKKGEKKKTETK
jgi:hypothetical protein